MTIKEAIKEYSTMGFNTICVIPKWYLITLGSIPFIFNMIHNQIDILLKENYSIIPQEFTRGINDYILWAIQENIYRSISNMIMIEVLDSLRIKITKSAVFNHDVRIKNMNELVNNKLFIRDFIFILTIVWALIFNFFVMIYGTSCVKLSLPVIPIDFGLLCVCLGGCIFCLTHNRIINIFTYSIVKNIHLTTAKGLKDLELSMWDERTETGTLNRIRMFIIIPINILITCSAAPHMKTSDFNCPQHTCILSSENYSYYDYWTDIYLSLVCLIFYCKNFTYFTYMKDFIVCNNNSKIDKPPVNTVQTVEQNDNIISIAELIRDHFKSHIITDPRITIPDNQLIDNNSQRTWRADLIIYLKRNWPTIKLEVDLLKLGEYFVTTDQNNKGAICYLIMLERNQLVPLLYNNTSLTYLRQSCGKQAFILAAISFIIKQDKQQYYHLGLSLKQMKLYTVACYVYSKILDEDPTDEKAQFGYNICKALMEEYPEQPLENIM